MSQNPKSAICLLVDNNTIHPNMGPSLEIKLLRSSKLFLLYIIKVCLPISLCEETPECECN
jgi:hypothetical protein